LVRRSIGLLAILALFGASRAEAKQTPESTAPAEKTAVEKKASEAGTDANSKTDDAAAIKPSSTEPQKNEPANAAEDGATAKPARPVPIGDRLRSALGIVLILGGCYVFSSNRKAISPRIVFWGLTLQWILAYIVLSDPTGQQLLKWAGGKVEKLIECSYAGSAFVFGQEAIKPNGNIGFVFAFRVLPTVIFMSALFAILYHIRIMPFVVGKIAWVMKRVMGISGAESLSVAASIFLGQTEAPLTIRPFLANLTRSELLLVMAAGMSHVSGGMMGAYFAFGIESQHILTAVLMTAPGTILICKLLIPETETPETLGHVHHDTLDQDTNVLDAASRGTRDGLFLALNIAAMLISFISLITLGNLLLGALGDFISTNSGMQVDLSLQSILGFFLSPVAWLMGIPWADAMEAGSLLGTRTIVNELIAYEGLSKFKDTFDPRTFAIMSFALCGFANLGSIGIQLGGIGALAPEIREKLAQLGLKAMIAGTLANYLSACIVGIIL
jgi:CNT family concentrative nucleoside transporter